MLKVCLILEKKTEWNADCWGSSSLEPVDGSTEYLQKDAGLWLSGPRFSFFLLFTPVAQSFRSGEDVTI